jgi:hypothetical protein
MKQIEKEFEECSKLCDQKLEISNESYYMIDSNLKKINEIISIFEKDLKTTLSPKGTKKNTLLDDTKTSISSKSTQNLTQIRSSKGKRTFSRKKLIEELRNRLRRRKQ